MSKEKLEKKSIELVQDVCHNFSKKLSNSLHIGLLSGKIDFNNLVEHSLSYQDIISNLQTAFENTKITAEKLLYLVLLPKN